MPDRWREENEMTHSPLILKDSTMREGLDVPGVVLDAGQKRELLDRLHAAGISEVEIVAPGRFANDMKDLRQISAPATPVRTSGLVYGYGPAWREQIGKAKGLLDRLDVLMPLADQRPPAGRKQKITQLREVLGIAGDIHTTVGAGLPHATQAEQDFVLTMCVAAVQAGARRITLYDTNGSADPWSVTALIQAVRKETEVEICFHAHNDLGMATANSLAAVLAGARCLDVTVNGLGDRAGNASLEQVALALHTRGIPHGLHLDRLRDLSRAVAAMTGVPVSQLAPVVGDFVFRHKSPAHLQTPELFEPYDPALVGAVRSLCKE
jgi:homocitrate synthase NifV